MIATVHRERRIAIIRGARHTASLLPAQVAMDDRIVILRTFSNEFEADLARAILEAHEIPAMVLRDDAGGMYPSLTFIHGVRLAVRGEDAEDALELLDAPISLPDDEAVLDDAGNDAFDNDAYMEDAEDDEAEEDVREEWETGDEWDRPVD